MSRHRLSGHGFNDATFILLVLFPLLMLRDFLINQRSFILSYYVIHISKDKINKTAFGCPDAIVCIVSMCN
jgi:hypothetical protein